MLLILHCFRCWYLVCPLITFLHRLKGIELIVGLRVDLAEDGNWSRSRARRALILDRCLVHSVNRARHVFFCHVMRLLVHWVHALKLCEDFVLVIDENLNLRRSRRVKLLLLLEGWRLLAISHLTLPLAFVFLAEARSTLRRWNYASAGLLWGWLSLVQAFVWLLVTFGLLIKAQSALLSEIVIGCGDSEYHWLFYGVSILPILVVTKDCALRC